jgi:hypothetical protein
MTTSIEHITSKIIHSYSQSLREKENIDHVLDHINEQKKQYRNFTKLLDKLSKLISQITWMENMNKGDEILIKGIIAMGKEADLYFKKYYATQRRSYAAKGWFKEEFHSLKEAIEQHKENILEVEHIIFELRKDKEFIELSKLIDEL